MLRLATPATPAYVPASRPIAFIAVTMTRLDESSGQYLPYFTLLDAHMKPIAPDMSAVPQQPPIVTAVQQAAFAAYKATAGQTPVQVCSAAALPIAAAVFGLTGLSVV
jgi:hypothetical protein